MTEWVQFPNFITKGIEIEKGDRRIFKGHITAEIIDRQQEFIFVSEVMKIMKTFMEVNPVISDFHSNRMVGQVLKYEQSEYQGVATVLITGEIYKKDGITLYDKIWDKIVKGEYRGLSMGGASKEREPIEKDGRMALELRKLELYEIALCETPANPFAIIESVNIFAKSVGLDQEMIKEENGREFIQCTTLACKFEKGTNVDNDVDLDNHQYRCDGTGDKCDICGLSKAEHELEPFNKPINGHDWAYWDEKLKEEYPDEKTRSKVIGSMEAKKGLGDATSLVGRSAETRSESVGESTGSPKEVNDLINSISAGSKVHKKDYTLEGIVSTVKDPEKQKIIMEQNIKNRTNVNKDYASQGGSTMKLDPKDQKKRMEDKMKDGIIVLAKHHQVGLTEEQEYAGKTKRLGELAGKRIITTEKDIHDESNNPAEHNQSIDEKMHTRAIIRDPKQELSKVSETIPEDKPKKWKESVNAYIEHFGNKAVRKALEDADAIEYMKKLLCKYN